MPAALSDRRVLVTGGSGFIGRQVVTDLMRAGAHVRVVDVKPHPDPEVEIVEGDLADPATLHASLDGGFDAVVHLAAVTSVLRSVEARGRYETARRLRSTCGMVFRLAP